MLRETISSAESITEFDGVNGTATKLLMVGLFWDFNFSNILTASIEDKFSNLIILMLAVFCLSNVFNKLSILSTFDFLSTISIELIEAILDRCACLPVIGLI